MKSKTGFFAFNLLLSCFILPQLSSAEPLPHDVQNLKKQREQAIEKIDSTYLLELEKLKNKYTKLGNLEVAISIDRMINGLKSDSGAFDSAAIEHILVGRWDFDYNGEKRNFEFKSNSEFKGQLATDGSRFSGEWKVDGKKIELWDDRRKVKMPHHLMIVSDDALIFIGPDGTMEGSRK